MIGGAALAQWLAGRGMLETWPLWVSVLAGVLIGYLVGGGIVWGVRIFGSLAFGKEAMGLGDVHLWAAVGACLGWIDATIGFFLAAPVGLVWVLIAGIFGGKFAKTMPYGPYLAGATLLVLLGKPVIEIGLTWLMGGGIGQPGSPAQPINLP
jgi:leader peptidase (prepilin peptidase)/N-methyltransferase